MNRGTKSGRVLGGAPKAYSANKQIFKIHDKIE